MRIEAIKPHGFCAGVTAAVAKAISIEGPVYALHPVVHSEIVEKKLLSRGFKFVGSSSEIPMGASVLISAHGMSPERRKELEARSIKIIDATCPFVARVHSAASKFAHDGRCVVIVGDEGHAEVEGIKGEVTVVNGACSFVVRDADEALSVKFPSGKIGVVAQTTSNQKVVDEVVEVLSKSYDVVADAKVCNATKERQDAVKAYKGEALLVLGSATSANTMRLCRISACSKVFRAANIEELKEIDFDGIDALGVTAGASTPESFFVEALEYLGGLNE